MEEILSAIIQANRVTSELSGLAGRVLGKQPGIVTDRNDPLGHGRVRCKLASSDGQTDWLTREEPCPQLSLPVPRLGDTVYVSYQDGDPARGTYTGVIQNSINPASDLDSLRLTVGPITLTLHADGSVVLDGCQSVTIGSEQISLEASSVAIEASSVSINGKQVATVGAADTRMDTLVNRGW